MGKLFNKSRFIPAVNNQGFAHGHSYFCIQCVKGD